MYWIDSHCHLNDEDYYEDIDQVLSRMKEADVLKAMIISVHLEDLNRALSIKDENITFKHSLGIYPGNAHKVTEEEIKAFEERQAQADVVAIGEIGLDYHYYKETKEVQKEIFIRQIELANKLNKPIIVHSREAVQDTYDILKAHPCKGVLHCFSDSAEMAKEFIKLGYYISISGSITFKNAKEPLEVIKVVPKDRLLIETDCPYLTPVPFRGQRNESSFVPLTGKKICEELGVYEEDFKKQINENYERLFTI